MTAGFDREQALGRIEAERPVAASHRRQQQLVDKFVQRIAEISLRQKQANTAQEDARDRVGVG